MSLRTASKVASVGRSVSRRNAGPLVAPYHIEREMPTWLTASSTTAPSVRTAPARPKGLGGGGRGPCGAARPRRPVESPVGDCARRLTCGDIALRSRAGVPNRYLAGGFHQLGDDLLAAFHCVTGVPGADVAVILISEPLHDDLTLVAVSECVEQAVGLVQRASDRKGPRLRSRHDERGRVARGRNRCSVPPSATWPPT